MTPELSNTLSVPRVREAPVAFECTLRRIVQIGDGPGGGAAVFGKVTRIHIWDDVYQGSCFLVDKLKPIGRLAGTSYTRVTDIFDMSRVPPPKGD